MMMRYKSRLDNVIRTFDCLVDGPLLPPNMTFVFNLRLHLVEITFRVISGVRSKVPLHFKLAPSVTGQVAHGEVTVKSATTIHAGAADDTSIVGGAAKGASYAVLGTFGPWTKVGLDATHTKIGFIASSTLTSGGSGMGTYTPYWNSTPPLISLSPKSLETNADTYKLAGSVSDETHVEDVYIFVSNQAAKIESRKVFYRSNRGGKNSKLLDFATDLPLWPGSNMVTIVARENSEVRSVKTLFVFRDPPRTAQTP